MVKKNTLMRCMMNTFDFDHDLFPHEVVQVFTPNSTRTLNPEYVLQGVDSILVDLRSPWGTGWFRTTDLVVNSKHVTTDFGTWQNKTGNTGPVMPVEIPASHCSLSFLDSLTIVYGRINKLSTDNSSETLTQGLLNLVTSTKRNTGRPPCRPQKLTTRSTVALAVGIVRNWRVMTVIRGNRAGPTPLHQTRTSTFWMMSHPSSFLPFTALLWISGICSQSCISSLVLSVSEIWGNLRRYDPAQQTTTIRRHSKLECERNTRKERKTYLLHARKLDMEMTADTLEAGGVHELFVSVTVDASFTPEQAIPSVCW